MPMIRKCVCCEKEYDYCPNCAKKKEQPAWMFSFCSEECKGLFNIVSAYIGKRIGKEEVIAYIAEHKLEDHYSKPVMRVLGEVLEEVKVESVKNEIPVVESVTTEEIKTEPVMSIEPQAPVEIPSLIATPEESTDSKTDYNHGLYVASRSRKKKKRTNTGYRISNNIRDIQ